MDTKRISLNPFEMKKFSRIIGSVIAAAAYLVLFRLTVPLFSSPTFAFLTFPAIIITITWGIIPGGLSTLVLFGVSYFLLVPENAMMIRSLTGSLIPPLSVFIMGIGGASYLRGLLKHNIEKSHFNKIVMDHAYDSEFWVDSDGILMYQSPSIERITGYKPETFLGKGEEAFYNIVHPDDREHFRKHLKPENHPRNDLTSCQYRIITKSETIKWVETISRPIFDRNGDLLGYRGNTRDITERKLAQEALKENEREYRTIVSNANSVIVKYDMEGRITFFNRFAEELFGFSEEEVIGKRGIETINRARTEEEREETERMLRELLTKTEEYTYNENNNYRQDGSEYWMAWTNAPLYNNRGEKTGILCIGNDITKQREAELAVKQSLEEKEILLREIHHRVKNNLQIISSILHLQRGALQLEEDKEIFVTCENRISSMALVHDHLYQSDNIARIDTRDYIVALTATILDSHSINPDSLKLHYDIHEIYLDIDLAIPCGLILTELITNSMKHAFLPSSDKKYELRILMLKEKGEIVLEIADNGPGMVVDSDWRKTNSLGLKLVDALADQLNAVVKVNNKGGLTWNIRFAEEGE